MRLCEKFHPEPIPNECRICWLWLNDPAARRRMELARQKRLEISASPQQMRPMPNLARRAANFARAKMRDAAAGFPRATEEETARRISICQNCPDKYYDGTYCRHPSCGCPVQKKAIHLMERCPMGYWTNMLKWAYGVTTCKERLLTLLPQTLKSLAEAGFDKPRLFIDGVLEREVPEDYRPYEITCRYPTIRTYGNWILGLAELYIRQPAADRYAIFQDDIIVCKKLMEYLSVQRYPETGYLNLYCFPRNEMLVQGKPPGFYQSNQRGLGAVALVFSRQAVKTLLVHQHMVDRPESSTRGHKSVDGGIVSAFRKSGWHEYIHNPSLTQHIGDKSSMGNGKHPKSSTFPGENFDCMTLLKKE